MSNENKTPSCLGYTGDEILHSYMGIIMIEWTIVRIPIKQLVRVFSRGSYEVKGPL